MSERPLPDGWHWVELKHVCISNTGTVNPSRDMQDERFIYIDIGSVDANQKKITKPKELIGKDAPSRARQKVRTGDILVSTTRPNLNSVALVPPALDNHVCSTGFCVLRPTQELDSAYLFGYVRSLEFINSLSSLVKGALYPAVTDSQVKAQFIPLPPVREQKRITAIVEEQMAVINAARSSIEAELEAAKALKAVYLRDIMARIENKNIGQRMTIGDMRLRGFLLEHQDGNHGSDYPRSSEFVNDGVKFVTAAQIQRDGTVDFEHAPCLTIERASKLRIGFAKQQDVLLAHNATVGPVAIADNMDNDFIVGTSLTIYRCNPEMLLPDYLFFALQSEDFQTQLFNEMKQSTRNQVPITKQRNLSLFIPPINEQIRVAPVFRQIVDEAENIRQKLETKYQTITAMPAAILRKAYKGEL